MTYRIRNILIAVGLALVAMMLTLFYVTNYKRSVQKSNSSVQVYVAAKDLAAGTAGADLVKGKAFRVETVQRKDVVPGAISSPEQVSQLVLTAPMYAGEQVTVRRFSDVAAQGIRSQLKGTMRAVQIPGDPPQLLSGTLQAGDHVDLVGNVKPSGDMHDTFTKVVLRDLVVLTAPTDSTLAKVSSTSSGSESVVLGVTDTQVQRLWFIVKNADWTLELRPVVNAADSKDRTDTLKTIEEGGK
jgi:Flp pilus assembly protein CpaB